MTPLEACYRGVVEDSARSGEATRTTRSDEVASDTPYLRMASVIYVRFSSTLNDQIQHKSTDVIARIQGEQDF